MENAGLREGRRTLAIASALHRPPPGTIEAMLGGGMKQHSSAMPVDLDASLALRFYLKDDNSDAEK